MPTPAQKITAWTSRGILTAIILIVGLSFGRQVLRWWGEDAAVPVLTPASEPGGWDSPGAAHELRFGRQNWVLTRQSVEGDVRRASETLGKTCARLTGEASDPTDPPGESQRRLLTRLAKKTPSFGLNDQWQVHQLEGEIPMAVGLRRRSGAAGGGAGGEYAVVAWGIGLPLSAHGWTLYTFVSRGTALSTDAVQSRMPIPQQGEPLLAVRAEGGVGLATFRGNAELIAWQVFYDRWAARENWRRLGDWSVSGKAVSARFQAANAETTEADVLDVRLTDEGDGRLSGLLLFTPGETEHDEGSPRP